MPSSLQQINSNKNIIGGKNYQNQINSAGNLPNLPNNSDTFINSLMSTRFSIAAE